MSQADDQLESAQFQLERAEHLTRKSGSEDWPKASAVLTSMMAKEQAMLTNKLTRRQAWLAERQPTVGDWQNFPTYLSAALRGNQGTSANPTAPKAPPKPWTGKDGQRNTRTPNPKPNTSIAKPLMDFTIPRTGGRPGAPAREGGDKPGQAKPNRGKPRNRSRSRKRKRTAEATTTSSTAPNPDQGNKRQRNKEDIPPRAGRSRSKSRKSKNPDRSKNRDNRGQNVPPQHQGNDRGESSAMDKKWQLISMLLDKI